MCMYARNVYHYYVEFGFLKFGFLLGDITFEKKKLLFYKGFDILFIVRYHLSYI